MELAVRNQTSIWL